MATVNFGFGINKPRVIDLDRNNLRKSDEILREMPELQTCIGCGACTALCTAGNLTSFNFRKVHTQVRRVGIPNRIRFLSSRGSSQSHLPHFQARTANITAAPMMNGRQNGA